MHDIKFIRDNFEVFKKKISNRNNTTKIDDLLNIDKKNRQLIQEKETLEKHFTSKSPLYLLEVETEGLKLVWEVSRNNQLFPHLYSPLPLDMVSRVYRIFIDDEGKHTIPEQVLNN